MKKLCMVFVLLLMVCAVAACSSKYSTLDGSDGGARIAYVGDPEEMLNDVHLVMLTSFPGRNLTLINNGGVRGYSTWTRVILDTYTQQALLVPVKAKDQQGEMITAYAIDVSGSGSSGTGFSRNKKLFKSLQETFNRKYKMVTP